MILLYTKVLNKAAVRVHSQERGRSVSVSVEVNYSSVLFNVQEALFHKRNS